ncbi:hypothetical protein R1flu_021659 [Riccia fluitans]|uniref:Uncharacterized protein n=1 Tax=Riccia fluitans TaxID=41844 RepID=A0ABD1ZRT8_9MARC
MAQEGLKSLEETTFSTPEGPTLCANNCGFFGTEAKLNFCSECYKIHMLSMQAEPGTTSTPSPSASTPVTDRDAHSDRESEPVAGKSLRPKSEPASPPATETDGTVVEGGSSSTVAAGAPVSGEVEKNKSGQGAPMRCLSCRKRVGLTGFKCKCGNIYCAAHRYFDKHNCTFDYKTAGREAIAQANPEIKADKIERC